MIRACVVAIVAMALVAPATQAAFPGENARIAYERGDDVYGGDVYSISPSGHSPRLEIQNAREPAYAPSGKRIAFTRGGRGKRAVYVTDGPGATRVTKGVSPSFSANGRRIAFVRGDDIWIAGPKGERRREQRPPPGTTDFNPGSPLFSPRGNRIVFGAEVLSVDASSLNVGANIYSMRADGSDRRRLAFNGHSQDLSHDGRRIVYSNGFCPESSRLCMMRANGKKKRAIKSPPMFGPAAPAFSPDGSRVVFGGDGDLWTIRVGGGDLTRLTDTPGVIEQSPTWGVRRR